MATELREKETPEQTLERIRNGFSENDVATIIAFANCGISPDDISPRENVLTFRAWKAKGRKVAKGATGQAVVVWVPCSKKKGGESAEDGTSRGVYPKRTYLFHESQTLPQDAPKGEKPAAWNNPNLVKEGTYDA